MTTKASDIFTHRITIVTGHYGTGKTEVSVNLALQLAKEERPLMMADMDIVNPYFRSRERRAELEAAGVRMITTSNSLADADIPAIPAEVYTIIEDQSYRGLLDVGGDPSGARVLARFASKILQEDYQMVYVVNANRPDADTCEKTVDFIRAIEATSGLKVTGLVNNTHLCQATTLDDLYAGAALMREVSEVTGIPMLCHTVRDTLANQVEGISEPLMGIDIYMKKPWER